jgi:lipopolysaccharide/colanic/teichoic acid biosynthesis glycosyltransferase
MIDRFMFREPVAYRRLQRVVGTLVALIALAIAAPLLILAALAILVEDGSPVLFRQRRVGRFGKLFTIYKLRTMRVAECADAHSPETSNDSRVTRVGRILRRTSIDELPQFINVLRGEMAVVGPRPEMPFIVHSYERWQNLRLLAPPGITGLWQTTVRSTIPLDRPEATRFDLDYINRASTTFDLTLIARTVYAMFNARGAF